MTPAIIAGIVAGSVLLIALLVWAVREGALDMVGDFILAVFELVLVVVGSCGGD